MKHAKVLVYNFRREGSKSKSWQPSVNLVQGTHPLVVFRQYPIAHVSSGMPNMEVIIAVDAMVYYKPDQEALKQNP